ncbi:MAG: hypothetical protein DLM61_13780 [Pseudonocardiales bacterium]|nr:MAG: hypothetical protein DLM61_13780 [Pseudonocardiales bacterium]
MSSMTSETGVVVDGVVGGVDTHSQTHHVAVIDHLEREVGDREFSATASGYDALVVWLRGFGELARVGVEGTSSYGAGLARHLRQAGVSVVEVNRPDRRARRAQGKSDPIDAYAAARAALTGTRTTVPNAGDGIVEAIRALREWLAATRSSRGACAQLVQLAVPAQDNLVGFAHVFVGSLMHFRDFPPCATVVYVTLCEVCSADRLRIRESVSAGRYLDNGFLYRASQLI